MANVSRPWGFRPERYLDGSKWTAVTQTYAFAAAQANDAYVGDMVTFDATNRSSAIVDNFVQLAPYVQPVVAAITTGVFRGIIVGFVPQPEFNMSPTASLGFMYRAASTFRYGLISEDTAAIYEAEETGNSYVTTSNNGINKTADIVYAAGSQVTGISGVTLNGAAFQTAAVRPWRALRYTQRVDNFNFVAADANSRAHWDVLIANSDLANANLGA